MHVNPAIGPFISLAHLGSGGLFDAYLATPPSANDPADRFTLKRLQDRHAGTPYLVPLLAQLVENMRHYQHPNLAQVFDVVTGSDPMPPGMPTLVYVDAEYVDGISFAGLLDQTRMFGPPPAEYVAAIGLQACQALDYLHGQVMEGRPVLHSGLNPQNVLLSFAGQVKLADAAFAQSRIQPGQEPPDKWAYISPEQANGLPLDVRSDLHSLALLMYELLTGQRAHHAQNPHDMLASVRAGRITPPSALRPTPPALEQVLMAALHPDPAARPTTARQMMGALQTFSANLPAFIQRLLPIQAAASIPISIDTLRQRAAMRRQSLAHWRLKSLLSVSAPAPVEPPVSRPSLPSASGGFGERPLSSPAVMAASPLSKSLSLKLSALIPPPNNNGESSTQAIDISALGILDDDAAAPRTQPMSAVPTAAPAPTPQPAPAEEEPASSTRAIDISALGVLDEDRKSDALASILNPASPPPAKSVAADVPESSTRAIDIDSLGILDEDRSTAAAPPTPNKTPTPLKTAPASPDPDKTLPPPKVPNTQQSPAVVVSKLAPQPAPQPAPLPITTAPVSPAAAPADALATARVPPAPDQLNTPAPSANPILSMLKTHKGRLTLAAIVLGVASLLVLILMLVR